MFSALGEIMLKREFLKVLAYRKKALLAALGALVAVSFSILAFSPACKDAVSAYREEDALLKIIKSSGAEFKSANVTGWVRVDEKASGVSEPVALANNVAAQLNLPESGRKVESWQNQFACGAKVEGLVKGGPTVSVLGQSMTARQGKQVSHIMVVVEGAERTRVGSYKSKIDTVLGNYGESRVALTCSGIINNELNKDELLEAAEKMMAKAGASIQEKTIKDNMVSLTGFTPRFLKDITYAGKEINVNVALRSNPVEHVTYVYVASPVIYTEY